MRVVTYARVSTEQQSERGASLENQERAFSEWLQRSGHTRVRAYREAASGGSIVGRAEFSAMIAELPKLKAEAVVIDTLDRFTRDLRDGLNLVEELRAKHVGLLPLDWRREKPIDLTDDRDWRDVVDEFTGAEAERRRIRKRIMRSYAGRRERGATTVNHAPYGTKKQGDRLVPDPEAAWAIAEIDRRTLEGETRVAVAEWAKAAGIPLNGITTIACVLDNRNYVAAGVRTLETQAKLDEIREMARERVKHGPKMDHVLTGCILCGFCVAAGVPRPIMYGGTNSGKNVDENGVREKVPALQCNRTEQHRRWFASSHRVTPLWESYMGQIAAAFEDPAMLERWAKRDEGATAGKRQGLERRLSQLDQRAAATKERRNRAFELVGDKDPAVDRQGRQALREIDSDEMEIHASREAVLGELHGGERAKASAQLLRDFFRAYAKAYANAPAPKKNELNRRLCRAIGSHPRLTRTGHANAPTLTLDWPEIDAMLGEPESPQQL